MKFINQGGPIKIRVGSSLECYWKTLKTGQTIELSEERGKILGLTKLETTSGQIGNKVVETKQIATIYGGGCPEYNSNDSFFKELIKIKGIGKKTAQDISGMFTKEKLIEAIMMETHLPFRDDVVKLLEIVYG